MKKNSNNEIELAKLDLIRHLRMSRPKIALHKNE